MTPGLPSGSAANPAPTRGSSTSAVPVRVFVLAGVRLYREGIVSALAQDDRFRVVGAAADGTAALPRLGESAPDVVLVEAGQAEAAALVRAIRAHAPEATVVALGIAEDEADVLPLAEAGISGWVTRDASVDDLRETVASAAAGEVRCSPRIAATLLRRLAWLAEDRRRRHATGGPARRQREIVALIDEGLSNKEIAGRLSIELATVKNHVHKHPREAPGEPPRRGGGRGAHSALSLRNYFRLMPGVCGSGSKLLLEAVFEPLNVQVPSAALRNGSGIVIVELDAPGSRRRCKRSSTSEAHRRRNESRSKSSRTPSAASASPRSPSARSWSRRNSPTARSSTSRRPCLLV